MNGIGDTWRQPRMTNIASGPFSRLVEVVNKTADIEKQFKLLDAHQKRLEARFDEAEQALLVRIENLEAQVPQLVAAAVADQLPEVRDELRGLIDEVVRSAAAQLQTELKRIADQVTDHDGRLSELERAHRVGQPATDKQNSKAK